MRKFATILAAFALLGTLAGCGGKGSKAAAPPPPASGGPQSREEALPVAQLSAQMVASYLGQVKSLIGVATVPGMRPARLRPLNAQGGAADTSSWTYSFQGYDATGAPINYVTQPELLSRLGMDWVWYYRSTGDSLLVEYDMRSHSLVDGLLASATRYVVSATDTMHSAYDGYTSGTHLVYLYDSRWQVNGVAWEKSGVPEYPVAGSITMHWHYVYDYTSGNQSYHWNYEVAGTVTFNGTKFATIVVGNYTFTVDLETGAVS